MIGRLLWPKLLDRVFGPNPVPRKFAGFPKEMALRPSQIRAVAEESAIMIPQAMRLRHEYRDLRMPVVIVAGENDRIVDFGRQSGRLHAELPGSELLCVAQQGHMIHQTATDWVTQAIELAGRRSFSVKDGERLLGDRGAKMANTVGATKHSYS
jgi:pimeloyl-ACP methyl ester carboxylesterase